HSPRLRIARPLRWLASWEHPKPRKNDGTPPRNSHHKITRGYSRPLGEVRHRVLQMEKSETIRIRLLEESHPPSIAAAFKVMGWNKSQTQYRCYLHEQVAGTQTCFAAVVDGQFAGYVTVNWRPAYAGLADPNIPEIQDLNVLTTYRRQGIAS